MIKHLRKNPIALLALFLALGGTSYAAGVPAPRPASGPTYGWVATVPAGGHNMIQFDASRSSGLTAGNFTAVGDNYICVSGLKDTPRNIQVSTGDVMLPAVQVSPNYGPCKGKQASIAFFWHDGQPAQYGSAYIQVVA